MPQSKGTLLNYVLQENLMLNFARPLSGLFCLMRHPGDILSWPLLTPTIFHRAACRVISDGLQSSLTDLLLLAAHLPPLQVTLSHHASSYFERALRLIPWHFSLHTLASTPVNKRPKYHSWRSRCQEQDLLPTSAP